MARRRRFDELGYLPCVAGIAAAALLFVLARALRAVDDNLAELD
jgi:hypothetical protein